MPSIKRLYRHCPESRILRLRPIMMTILVARDTDMLPLSATEWEETT
jgi:hypothetical protein